MSLNTYFISLAQPKDLAAIYTLQSEAGFNHWSESHIAKLIDNETLLVCWNETQGELKGFLFFSVVVGEAELLNIVVNPECRKQGIAMAMLSYFIQHLQALKANMLFLEVAETNVAALALYKKCQFKQVGIRKNYYKQAEYSINALLLSLML